MCIADGSRLRVIVYEIALDVIFRSLHSRMVQVRHSASSKHFDFVMRRSTGDPFECWEEAKHHHRTANGLRCTLLICAAANDVELIE